MKLAAGSALQVSLQWDDTDIQQVGQLAWRDRTAWLEYDEDYLRQGYDLSPVHHAKTARLETPYDASVFEGLHGIFADSLPDGWGRLLVDRRARQLDIEPATLTPLDRLACVGTQGIGALCYAPATDVWRSSGIGLDLDKLAADSRLVLEGEAGDVIVELGKAGGSPGGARPKALIALDDTGQALYGADPLLPDFTPYLVKFAGQGDPTDIGRIESAYAAMAAAAGVNMPGTRLIEGRNGQAWFAVRRFDREGSKRLHVQTASGLLYADIRLPSLDYRDLILLTRNVTRDQRQSADMFRLAVFNALAQNRDDHARQFSFLMARDGSWKMAPAYDLTFATGPGGEHSTTVMGLGKSISKEVLTALGRKVDLRDSLVAEVIDQVQSAVADWPRYAGEFDVSLSSKSRIRNALQASSGL